MSTTAKKPARVRKPKAETPVEAPKAEIAKIEPKPLTPAQAKKVAETLKANVERLQSLTATAKTGLEASATAEATAAEAFHVAAQALRAIRDEQLVEKVTESTEEPLTFKQYVETTFGRSRDLGDKWARAGQVLARLERELGDEIAEYPLPINEGQARGLGALLNADPKGQRKLVSKAWKAAFAEARTEATEQGAKTGFVPTIVIPAPRHVAHARAAVLPKRSGVNGSTKAPTGNTDHVAAKLRKIHAESFPTIEWGTFISIVAETAEVAHVAAKGVLRSIDAQ